MIALLACVLTALAGGALSVLRDAGAREHLQARAAETDVDEALSRGTGSGLDIRDVRGVSGYIRRSVRRRYAWPRFVLLVIAFALILLPDWSLVLSTGLGTFLLAAQGLRLSWMTALRGYTDHSADFSLRALLADGLAYLVKAILTFVCLLGVAVGGGMLSAAHPVPGTLLLISCTYLMRFVHLPARAVIRRSREWVAGNSSFGVEADRSSVLFLRSFVDDSSTIRTALALAGPAHPLVVGTRERFEEVVAGITIVNSTRMVAIGRPGERYPELGSARTYYPDQSWQEAVQDTSARCRAVVLIAGATDGLGWELGHLSEWGLLNKTVVLFPPEGDEDRARERFEHVLAHVGDATVPEHWDWRLWIGLAFEDGQVQHLVSDGRDWASYTASIITYFSELDGLVASRRSSEGEPSSLEDAIRRAGDPGRQRLGVVSRARITRAFQQGLAAIEAGDQAGEQKHFGKALDAAARSGVDGAVVAVRCEWATGLVEAARYQDAIHQFREAVSGSRERFPGFYFVFGEHMTATELEIRALAGLAELAGTHGAGDPEPAFVAWYKALVAAGKWHDAGQVADTLGENQRGVREVNEWFGRAADHFARVSDLAAAAEVELHWGSKLVAIESVTDGRRRLDRARELAQQLGLPEVVSQAETALAKMPSASAGQERSGFELFTDRLRSVAARAKEEAWRRGDAEIRPHHLLLAIAQEDSAAKQALIRAGVPLEQLRQSLQEDLGEHGTFTGSRIPLSDESQALLADVFAEQRVSGRGWIGVAHLLHALTRPDSSTGTVLAALGFEGGAADQFLDDAKILSEAPAGSGIGSSRSAVNPAVVMLVPEGGSIDPGTSSTRGDRHLGSFFSTAWDLGGVSSTSDDGVWESLRPEGLTDEPLSGIEIKGLRAIVYGGWLLRGLGLMHPLLKLAAWYARRRGAHGTADAVTLLRADSMRDAKPSEAAAMASHVLTTLREDTWITLADSPGTGSELHDGALELIADTLEARADFSGVVAVERRRLDLAPRLRSPAAPAEALGRLAFALARAGELAEADDMFERYAAAVTPGQSAWLMWSAVSLGRGQLSVAQKHLSMAADAFTGLGWSGAWGVRGDVAWAAGDVEEARRSWQRCLEMGREFQDQAEVRRASIRLAQI